MKLAIFIENLNITFGSENLWRVFLLNLFTLFNLFFKSLLCQLQYGSVPQVYSSIYREFLIEESFI